MLLSVRSQSIVLFLTPNISAQKPFRKGAVTECVAEGGRIQQLLNIGEWAGVVAFKYDHQETVELQWTIQHVLDEGEYEC